MICQTLHLEIHNCWKLVTKACKQQGQTRSRIGPAWRQMRRTPAFETHSCWKVQSNTEHGQFRSTFCEQQWRQTDRTILSRFATARLPKWVFQSRTQFQKHFVWTTLEPDSPNPFYRGDCWKELREFLAKKTVDSDTLSEADGGTDAPNHLEV